MRIAPGREQQERATPCGLDRVLVEVQRVRRQERQPGQRVVVDLLELLEPAKGFHARDLGVTGTPPRPFTSHMSVETFLLVLCVGGALLALWVDARFPGLAPADIWRAALRVVLALAVAHLVTPLLVLAISNGMSPGTALMTLVLPALVLFFLAMLWMMRALQGMLFGLRR